MATTIALQYGVWFGPGDASDWFEWEMDVTGETEEAYLRVKMLRLPLEEVPELESILDDARKEIALSEIDSLIDYDDEYVRKCTGRYPVDPDEINDLVRNRDPHTLQFFDLEGKSDEELDAWNANDEEELPDVCDFDETFTPSSPFDGGYSLMVEFAEHPDEEELGRREATETLRILLSSANGDYSTVSDYVERCEDLYTYGDEDEEYEDEPSLEELAEMIAEDLGLSDFALGE